MDTTVDLSNQKDEVIRVICNQNTLIKKNIFRIDVTYSTI